jgi:hypothetical protein
LEIRQKKKIAELLVHFKSSPSLRRLMILGLRGTQRQSKMAQKDTTSRKRKGVPGSFNSHDNGSVKKVKLEPGVGSLRKPFDGPSSDSDDDFADFSEDGIDDGAPLQAPTPQPKVSKTANGKNDSKPKVFEKGEHPPRVT